MVTKVQKVQVRLLADPQDLPAQNPDLIPLVKAAVKNQDLIQEIRAVTQEEIGNWLFLNEIRPATTGLFLFISLY